MTSGIASAAASIGARRGQASRTTSVPGASCSRGSSSTRAVGARHRALDDQRLQPRAAERQRLWHRRGQGLIKALAGRAAQRDAKLAREAPTWPRGPLADEDFPEPPRLRQLRRLVTAADRDADRRGHSNRRRCLSSASRRSAAGAELPAEIALPAGETRRRRHPRRRLAGRRHRRRATGGERIRVLDRATGAERGSRRDRPRRMTPREPPAIVLDWPRPGGEIVMDVEGEVARHYAQSELTRTVLDALRSAGKNIDALTPADLRRRRRVPYRLGAADRRARQDPRACAAARGARRRLGHRRPGAALRRAPTAATSPAST